MFEERFKDLEKKLELTFIDKDLLMTAFIHRSYPNEHPDLNLNNNERLEFLGDAVVEVVITDYLYKNFPNEQEGTMTSYRAALVRTENLANIAKHLGLNEYIQMSKGEMQNRSNENESVLADTLEALIGALYLDQGLSAVHNFVKKNIIATLEQILEEKKYIDPKTSLQAFAQEKYKLTPEYNITNEQGKDHEKIFTAEVRVGEKRIGEGSGKSKQLAETEAARNALKDLASSL